MSKIHQFIKNGNVILGHCSISKDSVKFLYEIKETAVDELEFHTNSKNFKEMVYFIAFYRNPQLVINSTEKIGNDIILVKIRANFFDMYQNVLEEWIIKQTTPKTDSMVIP